MVGLATLKEVGCRFAGHRDWVDSGSAFSADGNRMVKGCAAVAYRRPEVITWEVGHWKQLGSLRLARGPTHRRVHHPQGHTPVTGKGGRQTTGSNFTIFASGSDGPAPDSPASWSGGPGFFRGRAVLRFFAERGRRRPRGPGLRLSTRQSGWEAAQVLPADRAPHASGGFSATASSGAVHLPEHAIYVWNWRRQAACGASAGAGRGDGLISPNLGFSPDGQATRQLDDTRSRHPPVGTWRREEAVTLPESVPPPRWSAGAIALEW